MSKQERKDKVYGKIQTFLDQFKTVLVCEIKDLPADIIHKIRKLLRDLKSEVVCGKTVRILIIQTVISKSIHEYIENKLASHHNKDGLLSLVSKIENIQALIIFTNEDVSKINDITSKFIIEKQAKVGAISPIEVTLPAGPTGMDSSQIEYFQALNITTKLIKNQLEIINATKILIVGQKITLSEINLMKKFNIKPYKHFVQILHIYLNGKLYDNGILKITNDYLKKRVEEGIKNLTAFSLGANIPTKASAPHIVGNAFRNIIGLSLATNVSIPQAKAFSVVSSAPSQAVEAKKEAPKKEEKKKAPEPEPEPEEEGFGGLFD